MVMTTSTLNKLLTPYYPDMKTAKFTFSLDSENRASDVIDTFRQGQSTGEYILSNSDIKYKVKKDRKTGDIIDEYWLATVEIKEID